MNKCSQKMEFSKTAGVVWRVCVRRLTKLQPPSTSTTNCPRSTMATCDRTDRYWSISSRQMPGVCRMKRSLLLLAAHSRRQGYQQLRSSCTLMLGRRLTRRWSKKTISSIRCLRRRRLLAARRRGLPTTSLRVNHYARTTSSGRLAPRARRI